MKDIIIFTGQSNMQGQADKLLCDTPVEGALEYRFLTDSLIPLKNPCGEDIAFDGSEGYFHDTPGKTNWHAENALGSTCYHFTSMVPKFCEVYINEAAKAGERPEVTPVHAAKGATRVNYWLPGTPAYEVFIKKCRGAIAKSGETRRRFVVWLQGESDALASLSKDEYKAQLSEFGHALEKELGIDKFGIIRVGRFAGDARDDEIINAQDEICREDDFFVMLTDVAAEYSSNPKYKCYMNPNVRGHFGAEGLCRLGELAASELVKYI